MRLESGIQIEKWLIGILVFLIPTNLAWNWITPQAYIDGVLVDYLIPKFYLSDVPILLLFFSWLIKILKQKELTTLIRINVVKGLRRNWLVFVLGGVLLVRGLVFDYPLASTWFWFKLVEMGWLGWYLVSRLNKTEKDSPWEQGKSLLFLGKSLLFLVPLIALAIIGLFDHYPLSLQQGQLMVVFGVVMAIAGLNKIKKDSPFTKGKSLLFLGLSLAILFQSLLALYQFISQRSLIGYWLLGETTLTTSRVVSQGVFGGMLKTLPYGTTPHPNVLAGFLVWGMLTLLVLKKDNPLSKGLSLIKVSPFKGETFFRLVTTVATLTTLWATQSISAWVALAVGIALIIRQKTTSKHLLRLLIPLILLGLSGILAISQKGLANSSVTRRVELNEIAVKMIKDNPLFGVGLNNFTAVMSQYGIVSANTRFIQPVHNIYLLWLVETGLVGLILATGIVMKIAKRI